MNKSNLSQSKDGAYAWLAGLIDGDGAIGIMRYKRKTCVAFSYIPYIVINNNEIELLEKAKQLTSAGDIKSYPSMRKGNKGLRYNNYRWRLRNIQATKVINDILPYLTSRRKLARAKLCLTLQEYKGHRLGGIKASKGFSLFSLDEITRREGVFERCKQIR